MSPLVTLNPATGEEIARYDEHTDAEVDAALDASVAAFHAWRGRPVEERCERLRALAGVVRSAREDLARLMATEMGKPLREGRAEADKCALGCEYYADHAPAFLADEVVATDAAKSFVTYRPIGPVLAIMPWNFPLWQVFRFGAPAVAAGNTVVLKHAEIVTGCAHRIAEMFEQAGFPPDVLRVIRLADPRVRRVIEDRRIAAVTLTGSTRAGRAVAAEAGGALKKTVLELGGSDPYLVLADADLDRTVETCATARLINGGQTCIAAKRYVVVDAVREAFEAKLARRLQRVTMGDPMDESVDIGPQARFDLRDNLQRQVDESVAAGARLLLGGAVPDGPGAFYPPTLLADVRPGMPAFDEEVFGPVGAIVSASDEEEAIALANRTSYGLGAAVFTEDLERGERIARDRLEAGAAFVNAFVRSDPRLPFGGVKQSGYGRELGEVGIREFVNIKTVWVE